MPPYACQHLVWPVTVMPHAEWYEIMVVSCMSIVTNGVELLVIGIFYTSLLTEMSVYLSIFENWAAYFLIKF